MSILIFIVIVVSGLLGSGAGALVSRAGSGPWYPWVAWWAAFVVAMCAYLLLPGLFG